MRIITHMVVGPGEADRYLTQVLDRTARWVDDMAIALDPFTTQAEADIAYRYTDNVVTLQDPWTDHEGRFRQAAWELMESQCRPEWGDMILCLDADEIVIEPEPIRQIALNHPMHRLGFTFHEMWSRTEYRTDGFWKPYNAWVLIPWKPHGRIKDRALACGREPTYAANIPIMGTPVANILHYGYATEKDRLAKQVRYEELDGGRYHNPAHLRSITSPPQLAVWVKGGLL